jgi:hypothetical protein
VILVVTHPEVAFRDCAHCLAFVYDGDGNPELFRGKPLPRGNTPAPCQTAAGCPKGSPDAGLALSKRNQRALAFHRRCEAVGRWPHDAMVERNAVTIKAAEAEGDRILQERKRARRERQADR